MNREAMTAKRHGRKPEGSERSRDTSRKATAGVPPPGPTPAIASRLPSGGGIDFWDLRPRLVPDVALRLRNPGRVVGILAMIRLTIQMDPASNRPLPLLPNCGCRAALTKRFGG
ncbi:hypothetical protein RISK_004766 [Rhodopirellula islandica]|uniref:Uncharacterized protein n=1 Tax=Rhodopirellula islandica TaxID=595434 RepID=A0A0J1ED67_RHOIS|nr:hypothetical protein RISK_004766 [Rhodopirellula islandica]